MYVTRHQRQQSRLFVRNVGLWEPAYLYQGLSKHPEVSSTPVTKVNRLIVIFWDFLGAPKR